MASIRDGEDRGLRALQTKKKEPSSSAWCSPLVLCLRCLVKWVQQWDPCPQKSFEDKRKKELSAQVFTSIT